MVIRSLREDYMVNRMIEITTNTDYSMSQYKFVGIVGARHVHSLNKKLAELKAIQF